jgi:hypothetical protein
MLSRQGERALGTGRSGLRPCPWARKNIDKKQMLYYTKKRGNIMENFLKGLVFIVITGFLGSCDTPLANKDTVEFDYAKFNAERALWDSNNPPDYQYNLEYQNNGFFWDVNTIRDRGILSCSGKFSRCAQLLQSGNNTV